jgi:glycosyltransferase involved in cell wall biosynthesis
MGYRVAVIHQGFVPIYRKGLFELLNSRTGNEYVIFGGAPLRGSAHVALPEPYPFPHVRVRNREIGLAGRVAVYQPLVGHVLRGRYDAIVVGHEFKFLASMILFGAFKLLRRPAVLWGHGYHRSGDSSAARRVSGFVARSADGYLAYTDFSAEKLRAAGVALERITVVRNTIDMAEQDRAHAAAAAMDPAALRAGRGLRPDSRVLLYVGRLEGRKRIEDLVRVAEALAADPAVPPTEAIIVGDGPRRAELEKLAQGVPNARLLGAIYDPLEVAKLMRLATAVVMPGQVGLAVNHAFSQGVPVVTRIGDFHSPEVEYIKDGVNGLMVPDDGLATLVAAVRRLLVDEPLRARLAAGALATRGEISLDRAVERFDQGVVATIERRGRRRRS